MNKILTLECGGGGFAALWRLAAGEAARFRADGAGGFIATERAVAARLSCTITDGDTALLQMRAMYVNKPHCKKIFNN